MTDPAIAPPPGTNRPESPETPSWVIVVRDGRIIDRHPLGEHATQPIYLTLGGSPADLYLTGPLLADPPDLHEEVDPAALGWTQVG